MPWIVLTDEPQEFADLAVHAVQHLPTGPMAVDFLNGLLVTGMGRGNAAYHDKRFALLSALEDFNTAIFVDADSRVGVLPSLPSFAGGLAVLPVVQKSIAEHLETCGSWRRTAFLELARHLTGSADILGRARWCHETIVAVTKDGRESHFFSAWSAAVKFFQARGIYSGEGGVIGLAAAVAGWEVDYDALSEIAVSIKHEGGGPKKV